MATGLHAVNLANPWLDMLGATAFTAPAATWIQLHTSVGDPGAAGTANVASTTRKQLTWSAASGGSKAITATLPSWTNWADGSVTLSYCSVWSLTSAGVFYYSFALTTPKAVTNGDTVNLTSHSVAFTPLAA
jgi:hypothetical protein